MSSLSKKILSYLLDSEVEGMEYSYEHIIHRFRKYDERDKQNFVLATLISMVSEGLILDRTETIIVGWNKTDVVRLIRLPTMMEIAKRKLENRHG